MRLHGKVALITGAGAGIGRACADLFAEEGAKVVVAERDRDAGEAVERSIRSAGGECTFVQTDVSDHESVKAAVERAVDAYGRLDIVYNNAGGSSANDGRVTDIALDEFWTRIGVDLFGVWAGCKYAIPHLKATGGGAIINATSTLAMKGVNGRDAYTAAKGGIISITRSMAVEYAADGIRVNAIAPGLTTTERVRKRLDDPASNASKDVHRSLLGPVEPREVAYAVLFLASDEARKITGQVIVVDSGLTIG